MVWEEDEELINQASRNSRTAICGAVLASLIQNKSLYITPLAWKLHVLLTTHCISGIVQAGNAQLISDHLRGPPFGQPRQQLLTPVAMHSCRSTASGATT